MTDSDRGLPRLAFDREEYLTRLLCELTGLLQDMVGRDDAKIFVGVVGKNLGTRIDHQYRRVLGCDRLDREQVGIVIEDLTRRIGGTFMLDKHDACRLVYRNSACPFDTSVHERQSLCSITSNVIGTIAADNLGYAKVCLENTIADGANACRVVVYLDPDDERARCAEGDEYQGR